MMRQALLLIVSVITVISSTFSVGSVGAAEKSVTKEDIQAVKNDLAIYEDIAKSFDSEIIRPGEKLYNPDDLTQDILINRKKKNYIIAEKNISVCIDSNGNGVILNTNSNYNYINFECCSQKIKKGDVILTYLFYNPDTSYIDDIIERIDNIIDENTLK